jgi:hypothetical protein
VCGWFTSGWLRITIQLELCGNSTFFSKSLPLLRSITSKCWCIARTSTHREVVKGGMWIGHNIIGEHRTNSSCLSRSPDRTNLLSIMLIWDSIIREGWLQFGMEWTLRNNWVNHYRTSRSMWMSWHTYHIHIRMPERLAFNQTIYSYSNSSHNLWYRIKNVYADVTFSQKYSHHY